MGLLNDTKSRKKLSVLLIQHSHKINILSFMIGIIWFCLLASDVFNNKTYFSENALLPGLVVREFNPGTSIKRLLESLKEEASSHSDAVPYSWIQAQFRQVGLDVYINNFTLNYPFGSKPTFHGKNLYAILRAPKVPSTEALVISTPYRGFESIHENTLPSIALMIELAKTFRSNTYWSKDIIFLIAEHEMIGFQAWLDSYHGVSNSDYIISEKLKGSSGLIQGVVNLEISNDHFSHIDVKIEGLHGQLPNLDLFNLAVELCNREQVATSFQSRFNYYPAKTLTWESWKSNFLTMFNMMLMQATGLPTGGHGLFHRYGIQAVTLKSIDDKISHSTVSISQVGRVLEGITRSLNNLLEKFHQSFFFYLLPSTRSYVSIGLYMPPFALIAVPVLIKALYLYLNIQTDSDKEILLQTSNFNYWSSLDIIFIHICFGTFMHFSPSYVDHIKSYLSLSTEDSLYILHVGLLLLWFLLSYFFNKQYLLSKFEFEFKMCIVLLTLGGFLFTLALVNISFATILTVLFVPVAISLQYRGRFSFLQYLNLIVINPFVFTYLIVIAQSYMIDSSVPLTNHFARSLEGHKKIILYTVEDSYLFGNWNYKLVTLIILPLWFNLWCLKTSVLK